MTHICVGNLTIIGSDNGLSPGRRQAIIWTNAGILLIGPLGTNFSENRNRNLYIFIQENAFENVVWKMASILFRPLWVKRISTVFPIVLLYSINYEHIIVRSLDKYNNWWWLLSITPMGVIAETGGKSLARKSLYIINYIDTHVRLK